ncbi:60S ribosomal protein L26A [Pestalotiopsis sp. IQ-011]
MMEDSVPNVADAAPYVSAPNDVPAESDLQENESPEVSTSRDSALYGGQDEIISELEVDSNRSDNDSSLGSDITSLYRYQYVHVHEK